MENHSRQKELTELAELRIERLQLKFRLLYSEKQVDNFWTSACLDHHCPRVLQINCIILVSCNKVLYEPSAGAE